MNKAQRPIWLLWSSRGDKNETTNCITNCKSDQSNKGKNKRAMWVGMYILPCVQARQPMCKPQGQGTDETTLECTTVEVCRGPRASRDTGTLSAPAGEVLAECR